MDRIIDFAAMEFHGVPIISMLTAVMALVCIVPFWGAAIRMTACKRMRGMRIGATVMMGPLLWYLLEPIWLWFEADYVTTASLGTLVTLTSVATYFWFTQGARMILIEEIRATHDEAHA